MSAADENQVLSQAEIDAMLGNAAAGSELDDPLTATAPPVAAGAAPEPATVVWSTASPQTPLVPSTPPGPEDEPGRTAEPAEQKGGRRGLFGKILGKPSGPAGKEAPAAPPPQSAAPPPAPARPRPALDIEDDLAAAGTDELDATPVGAAFPEPDGTPTAAPLDAVEDVMSVFLEHEGMDPMLRRLVERVPDVSVEELLTELREICGLLGIEPQQREERAA